MMTNDSVCGQSPAWTIFSSPACCHAAASIWYSLLTDLTDDFNSVLVSGFKDRLTKLSFMTQSQMVTVSMPAIHFLRTDMAHPQLYDGLIDICDVCKLTASCTPSLIQQSVRTWLYHSRVLHNTGMHRFHVWHLRSGSTCRHLISSTLAQTMNSSSQA